MYEEIQQLLVIYSYVFQIFLTNHTVLGPEWKKVNYILFIQEKELISISKAV